MLVVVDFIDAPKTPMKMADLKKDLPCNLDQARMRVLQVTWHVPQSVVPNADTNASSMEHGDLDTYDPVLPR